MKIGRQQTDDVFLTFPIKYGIPSKLHFEKKVHNLKNVVGCYLCPAGCNFLASYMYFACVYRRNGFRDIASITILFLNHICQPKDILTIEKVRCKIILFEHIAVFTQK